MVDFQKQLNEWFAGFDQRMDERVPFIVAETATEFFQDRFKTQEWDKVPWQALSPKYAAKKTRGAGRILTQTSLLRASIRPTVQNAGRVVISAGNSKVPYARIHNEGLRVKTIANVRPYVNTNFFGKGKRVQINAHTRRINYKMPRRRFMGPSRYLNQAIINRLTKAL